MATVAQAARIVLRGFKAEGITSQSPLEDQVVLTYRAAYHFAQTNGFEPWTHRGVSGMKGPMVMRRITDYLFDDADKTTRDKINGLVSQVLRKTDAAVCLKQPGSNREEMPVWFVANNLPPNITIVALSHANGEAKKTGPSSLAPTYTERRLTPEEAGETKPPGEVTVTHGEPKNKPDQRVLDAFKEQNERIAAEHREFVEEVYQTIERHAPVAATEVKFLMRDRTTDDSSAVLTATRELLEEGRLVGRVEEDDERLIRGGGHLPKGRRLNLLAPAPGPVPKRTALPEGVPVRKAAAEWDRERKEALERLCDKVLDVMTNHRQHEGRRVKSLGAIADVAGLSRDDTRTALNRLIEIGLVYKGESSGNYHLTERRRGPRETGAVHQPAQEVTVPPAPPAPAAQDDLVAQAHSLIDQLGRLSNAGELEQLREQNAQLAEENRKLTKQVMALRAAVAALEE